MENEIVSQVVIAGLCSYVLERLKKSSWFPVIDMNTKKLNSFVAAGMAAAASIGINFQYDQTAGTLLISGLTLATFHHVIWDFAKQYLFQQMVYDTAIKKKEVKNGNGTNS